jgi:transcriptional regulator with XRE-family HTH domain
MGNDPKTTDLMQEALEDSRLFSEFETAHKQQYIADDFRAYIDNIIKEKGLSKAEVIKRADLERTYGYQMLRGVRKPSRDKLIQFAFGLRLNTEEAARMFKLAGYLPMYPRIQREAAILFCLNKGYTYTECMIFLDSL